MKLFLIEVVVLSFVALGVSAYFFRSRRAVAVLKRLRLAGWAYVAMVILMAALQVVREAW